MGARAQHTASSDYEMQRSLEIFNSITRQLDMYYVDTLSLDTVVRWAIDGMLENVDPFTSYYPGDDIDELKTMATGKYAGIGSVIHWREKDKRCVISEPYENTPASEAGLRCGDLIMSIDGEDMLGKMTPEVSNKLRGEAGTTFLLKVKRQGKDMEFKVTRRTIQLPQVPYYGMRNDSVGYIILTGFTDGAATEVRHALVDLKKKGCRRLMLDLRNNGGGSLQEAIDIVGLFVPHGSLVVSTKGKVESSNRELRTTTEPLAEDMPLCVLVNSQTASSAEIVSGALQDLDRAVIIGQRTYGKGLVQAIRDTPFNGSLKITTSRYYIPSGRCIQAYDYRHLNEDGSVGVVPDSVTHLFHTAAGREVRDGGGIKPDVVMKLDSFPTFILELGIADALDDWCVSYIDSHATIAPAEEFRLSDDDWQQFKQAMIQSGFKSQRRSVMLLKGLRQVAAQEGIGPEATAHFEALDSIFAAISLNSDMENYRTHLSQILEGQIVRAYYYERGNIQHMLRDDEEVQRAIEILTTKEYTDILHP